jgi:hypothetical protein
MNKQTVFSRCYMWVGYWRRTTPTALTVKFHNNRPANVFKITKYTYADDSVRLDWLNGTKESVTVFAEFSGSKMAQQQNGDKPRRVFHRC